MHKTLPYIVLLSDTALVSIIILVWSYSHTAFSKSRAKVWLGKAVFASWGCVYQLRPSKPRAKTQPQCLQAASAIINVMIEQFVPTGFIRYVPELVFAQTAFASAVLLKVRSLSF